VWYVERMVRSPAGKTSECPEWLEMCSFTSGMESVMMFKKVTKSLEDIDSQGNVPCRVNEVF